MVEVLSLATYPLMRLGEQDNCPDCQSAKSC
jgi:hypothetical protein